MCNIKEIIIETMARYKYKNDEAAFVDFAFYLIENNVEVSSVYTLAGLKYDSIDDKRKYFSLVLHELNMEIPDEKTIVKYYGEMIVKNIINKNIDPKHGIKQLSGLWVSTGYGSEYYEFDALDDAISLFEEGICDIPGMTKSNMGEYIIRYMELYLIYEDMVLPAEFYKQAYCAKCGSRSIPILKNMSKFPWQSKGYKMVCSYCKHDEIYSTQWNKGKELYLEEIRNCS
jgi:hypothetical protein